MDGLAELRARQQEIEREWTTPWHMSALSRATQQPSGSCKVRQCALANDVSSWTCGSPSLSANAYIRGMVYQAPHCPKCGRRNIVSYRVEPRGSLEDGRATEEAKRKSAKPCRADPRRRLLAVWCQFQRGLNAGSRAMGDQYLLVNSS